MRLNVLAPPETPAAVINTPTPPPPACGVKKVSFGKLAKKSETKTAYPVFANPEASLIAARIVDRQAQFEALKGALETDKAELKMMVAPHYFKVNHGRHEVPSSISVPWESNVDGEKTSGEVLVTFQNRYAMLPDESGLALLLSPEHLAQFFRQHFELKIKGESLPAEQTQALLNELETLFARYNATDALEVTEGVKPTKEFHDARHLVLTPEQNLALESAVPIVPMVKTKGRK